MLASNDVTNDDHVVSHRAGATMTIIVLLASLNSCTNPWIYILYLDNVCAKLGTVARGSFTGTKHFSVFSYKD